MNDFPIELPIINRLLTYYYTIGEKSTETVTEAVPFKKLIIYII